MQKVELICLILNYGSSNRVIDLARKYKIKYGLTSLATGTAPSVFLDVLGLFELRKECVLLVSENETKEFIEKVVEKFKMDKPNKGIVFTSILNKINSKYKNEGGNHMHNCIYIVVEKGLGEKVVDVARDAGARGGTIVSGRGSLNESKKKLFEMEIEPEKEVVMIVTKVTSTEKIIEAIKLDLTDKRVLIFTQPLSSVYGLSE